jgi:hypothetical protein
MSQKIRDLVMVGILICLVIIALKPTPSYSFQSPPVSVSNDQTGESVVQLSENKIAVVKTNTNSGMHGQILVFEFDEKAKTFRFIGHYNYQDYFRNPQNYGLKLPD